MEKNQNGAPPIKESIEEAAQQRYGKNSKLDVAFQAANVQDWRALQAADRKAVADYRMKLKDTLGADSKEPDAGDIIVADDVKITHSTPASNGNGLKGAALAAALLAGGGGMGAGVVSLLSAIRQPAATVDQRTETWRGSIRLGWKDGKPVKQLLDEAGNVVQELP